MSQVNRALLVWIGAIIFLVAGFWMLLDAYNMTDDGSAQEVLPASDRNASLSSPPPTPRLAPCLPPVPVSYAPALKPRRWQEAYEAIEKADMVRTPILPSPSCASCSRVCLQRVAASAGPSPS